MRTALLPSLLFIATLPAFAQTNATADAPSPCIDVEVNGERVRDYDCLSRLMTPAKPDARPPATTMPSEDIARRPSNQLFLFNQEATRQRMGNTFGTSVHSQRPPEKPLVSPVIPPRP